MKDLLRYKGFLGSIEVSIGDNCIHGKILFIDDVVTYEAESPAQLEAEFKAAVEDYLATCKALGRDPNKPFSGSFNVRIGPDLHQKIAKHAAVTNSSINEVVKQALIECLKEQDPKEVIHRHYHTFEYNNTFDVDIEQVTPWGKEPILKVVN
jgi:predicted HicB family RNase H-like nuclease